MAFFAVAFNACKSGHSAMNIGLKLSKQEVTSSYQLVVFEKKNQQCKRNKLCPFRNIKLDAQGEKTFFSKLSLVLCS